VTGTSPIAVFALKVIAGPVATVAYSLTVTLDDQATLGVADAKTMITSTTSLFI
jgi:hypothetical protein